MKPDMPQIDRYTLKVTNRSSLWSMFLAFGLAAGLSSGGVQAGVIYSSDFDTDDGGWTASDLGGNPAPPWTYGAAAGVGGNGAWFVNTSSTVSHKVLTSASINVATTGPVTISFSHRFNFEPGFDGGNLQISVNGGSFSLVPQLAFNLNSYTHTISGSFQNPIAGQRAWSATSSDYLVPEYIESSADLGTFNAMDSLRFRFQAGWDNSISSGTPNWVIDNVVVTDSGDSAVPEPATLALLGLGIAGLGVVRHRRTT